MSQGFLFAIKNETSEKIALAGDGIDDCIDQTGTVPGSVLANTETKNIYAQVRTFCDNGVYEITFTPTSSAEGSSGGKMVLNFDKSTSAQNPYGTIAIQSFTPAIISSYKVEGQQITYKIVPTVSELSVDSGDEWAYAVISLDAQKINKPVGS